MSTSDQPRYLDPALYVELVGFDDDWRDQWWHDDFLLLMLRRWAVEEARVLVDVGCGVGHWGQRLLSHLPHARLVGIDREPQFVEMARERAARRGLAERCQYQVGDVTDLGLDGDMADLVTCQTVLIHVDAPKAVAEMVRVARPGGVIAAAEPDNLASTIALLNTSLDTPAEQLRALLELQQICERGKARLGEGNSSVGALLPGIFQQAGLRQIRAWQSDTCALLLPPYEEPGQRVDLARHLEWYRGEAWFTGQRDDSLRAFRAGGGEEASFEALWSAACAWMAAFCKAAEEGRFHAARGFVHYLISGCKKP